MERILKAWARREKFECYQSPFCLREALFEHRRSNNSHAGENVAHAQPSVAKKEDEIQIQILNRSHVNAQLKILMRMIENQEQKWIKQEPEDEPQSWAQEEQKEAPPTKPWADKKDYQAIFRKYSSIGEDGEENYDVMDIQIEAQKAVRRITDHLEIVKQYQKVVRALIILNRISLREQRRPTARKLSVRRYC